MLFRSVAINVIPGVAAATWFVLCTLVIAPALGTAVPADSARYAHLGDLPGGFVSAVVMHPAKSAAAMWRGLFGGNLAWATLLPFLLLPLLRPRWIVMAAPIFAEHLLSAQQSEWSVRFHHAAPLVPLLWIGAAEIGRAHV